MDTHHDLPVETRQQMINLLNTHLAESTRKAIDTAEEAKDIDTTDLFTEVSRGLDKSLWFLEAHLQMD